MSRLPSSAADAAGLDPDLGRAEQPGEQPLLDGDVLDPIEGNDPALAAGARRFSMTISPAPTV